jgi:hypothetical protein
MRGPRRAAPRYPAIVVTAMQLPDQDRPRGEAADWHTET